MREPTPAPSAEPIADETPPPPESAPEPPAPESAAEEPTPVPPAAEPPPGAPPPVRQDIRFEDSPVDARLRQRLGEPLDARIQEELALLVHLREEAASVLGPAAADCVQLGLTALLGDKPNLRFARDIRKRIASQLADAQHPLRLGALLKTDSPSFQVMLGLGGSLVVVLLLAFFGHRWLAGSGQTFFDIPLHLFLLASVGGAVGSVTSILVRIQDFKQSQSIPPASMMLVGLTKPVVGATFALFAMAMLKSGLLPIHLPEAGANESYFFLALCFVSGFSERLAQDMVARLEGEFEPERTPRGDAP